MLLTEAGQRRSCKNSIPSNFWAQFLKNSNNILGLEQFESLETPKRDLLTRKSQWSIKGPLSKFVHHPSTINISDLCSQFFSLAGVTLELVKICQVQPTRSQDQTNLRTFSALLNTNILQDQRWPPCLQTQEKGIHGSGLIWFDTRADCYLTCYTASLSSRRIFKYLTVTEVHEKLLTIRKLIPHQLTAGQFSVWSSYFSVYTFTLSQFQF